MNIKKILEAKNVIGVLLNESFMTDQDLESKDKFIQAVLKQFDLNYLENKDIVNDNELTEEIKKVRSYFESELQKIPEDIFPLNQEPHSILWEECQNLIEEILITKDMSILKGLIDEYISDIKETSN